MNAAFRLDPRVKLLLLMQAGLWAVLFDRPEALGIAAGLSVFVLAVAGLRIGQGRRVLWSLAALALVLWGMAVTQGLFYRMAPRTPLLVWQPESAFLRSLLGPEGLALYSEGIAHGLTQGLRLVLAAAAGLALAFTTDPGQLLAGLSSFRVPYGLAFMSVTALRFAPLLAQESHIAWRAARLRGFSPWRTGPVTALSVMLGLLRPVLASCVRRATTLAASVSSRGFDPAQQRQIAGALRMNAFSLLAAVTALLASAALAAAKVLYLLYIHDVFYRTELRELYQFVRAWL